MKIASRATPEGLAGHGLSTTGVDVAWYKIINVCKHPRSRFTPTAIAKFPHPSLYVDDFNCQHVNWGYNKTSDDESLDTWATSNNLGLLYNPKETASFFSHRWNVGTNPDLAFASFVQDSRLPERRVLGKIPRSQHRPPLITPLKLKVPTHSDPVKHWNFRKADWKWFCLLTDESVERLLPPGTSNIERAYQDFCKSLISAAKQCIPRGRRKNYVPFLGQRVRDLLSLLHTSPSGDWLWWSRFIPTISARTEEAGVMGGSCQFHRLLVLYPQGVENHQQT